MRTGPTMTDLSRRRLLGLFGASALTVLAAACGQAAAPSPQAGAQPPAGAPTAGAKPPAEKPEAAAAPKPAGEATKPAGAAAPQAAPTAPAPAAAQQPGAAQKVTITYWDWWNMSTGPMGRMFDYLPKGFAEVEPNITLNLQNVPFAEYFRKYLAAHAAGDVPDAMHCSIWWARSFFDRAAVVDLGPFIKDTPSVARDQFLPGAILQAGKGSTQYGLPGEGPDHQSVYFNLDHFKEAGLPTDLPTLEKWTWNDLTKAAISLTRRDAGGKVTRSGLLIAAPTPETLAIWAGTAGINFFNSAENAVTFNDNNTAVEGFNWWLELLDKASAPISPERQDFNQFLRGTTSMVITGPWNYSAVKEQAPQLNWSAVLFPARPAPGGRLSTAIWDNVLVLPTKAKNRDAGWKLLTYWCGLSFMQKRLDIGLWLAPRKDFYEAEQYKKAVKDLPVLDRVPQAAQVGAITAHIEYEPLAQMMAPISQAVMLREKQPAQAVPEIVAGTNEILAKAGYK
jgi:multiple sugar transport system substrate-binding protein